MVCPKFFPSLIYIGGPNMRHYIFTWKLRFWGPSRVSKIYLFFVLFFSASWANQNGSWTQKRKVKRKGIWETPPIYLIKL
jgi:hypothetical protein